MSTSRPIKPARAPSPTSSSQELAVSIENTETGVLVATFRARSLKRGGWLSLMIGGLIGVLTPTWIGLRAYEAAFVQYGSVAAELRSRPWFIVGATMLVFFAFLILYWIANAKRFIAIYKNGVAFHLFPSRGHFFRWNDLAGISIEIVRTRLFGLTLSTQYQAYLFPNVGRPIHIPQKIKDLPELVSRIKASLYPRLKPAIFENFKAGHWVYFGPIAIQQKSFRINRRAYPLSELESINVTGGFLLVQFRNNGLHRLSILRIPNLELLLQLIQDEVKV
jgi:hypothetical protein